MSALTRIAPKVTEALAHQTFTGLGCKAYGIAVFKGADSWGAHESGLVEIPTDEGTLVIPVAYDERGGPYATGHHGNEQLNLLLSLSDEEDYLVCAWARVEAGSPLMGLGVDLSTAARFAPREGRRDYIELIYTNREKELMPQLNSDPWMARAQLFSAKEAAFKCTARPLRDWYLGHDEELIYEVRHFCMVEPGLERGEARNAAAQQAMDRMGIAQVSVSWTHLEGMALVAAVALSDPNLRTIMSRTDR